MAQKDVEQAISRAVAIIENEQRYEDTLKIHEMNTRYILIDPVLRALGWDLSNPDQVTYELDLNDYGKIDYVLFGKNGNPCILLEAKVVDSYTLAHERQLISYVQGTNKGFAVLTNGNMWRVWDLAKRGGFDKKLIADLLLEDGPARQAAQFLNSTLRRNLF